MTTAPGPHLFGIRHLSAGGAHHLRLFLEEIRPTAVLIEGPADAGDEIAALVSPETRPPVAILAYTTELPVRTILYPFAAYSPEYAALAWAAANGVPARFIDLPSDILLALEYGPRREDAAEAAPETDLADLYRRWAELAGEPDHEAYWERDFEHNTSRDAYRRATLEFGRSLRELAQDCGRERARNLVREAHMRRCIAETVAAGHDPARVVVVAGAYHTSALTPDLPPITDEELGRLPRLQSRWTLMPYSYLRLSSRAGYGAGNLAPAYYELLWNCLRQDRLDALPALFLAEIAHHLKAQGTYRSPAEVLEGVRLGLALAALHHGQAPTLADLRDAALVCLGHGDRAVIAEALARAEIGTGIGELPAGVSRTPIQEDFDRELRRLKLERFRTTVANDLHLDLRENRQVQSEEAAFLDLQRSFFLHRLAALGVSFAEQRARKQEKATWAESWVLQWTPEAEIELVESTLRGETVAQAASFAFKERLEAGGLDAAAEIIRQACLCGLPETMETARIALQHASADSTDFATIAAAASELATTVGYGEIRRFDPAPLVPLLQQLFIKAALHLVEASACNDEAARALLPALHRLQAVAVEHFAKVDGEFWFSRLAELARRDDRNPLLSGFACALLLEKGRIDDEELGREISRRLSPGLQADLGAGWFEGLSLRNRYALLSRLTLWQRLDEYLASLDETQFRRALVFLRRALGGFAPGEKRRIAEILGELWGVGAEAAELAMGRPLSEEEKKAIESLKDFDFGDV